MNHGSTLRICHLKSLPSTTAFEYPYRDPIWDTVDNALERSSKANESTTCLYSLKYNLLLVICISDHDDIEHCDLPRRSFAIQGIVGEFNMSREFKVYRMSDDEGLADIRFFVINVLTSLGGLEDDYNIEDALAFFD